jgi:nucleotide-binding universal stress UspA family protein
MVEDEKESLNTGVIEMLRLLVATDLLPKSEFAIDRAGLLADELAAELSLVHVVSPVSSERVLEQSLQIAIGRMKSRVRSPLWRAKTAPDVVVRAGNPARVILDTIAREEPDLLIVGPHERRSVVDALQGTILEKVVSARRCPVLVVQQSASGNYRDVLLALDAAEGSRAAVRAAERFVLRDGAKAAAIHACTSPDHAVLQLPGTEGSGVALHTNCSPGTASAAMRELLERESADPKRYELIVANGNPLPTIMHAIESRQPDLLVVGTRGDGRMRRAVLGSVANLLLKLAPCDMLIVPQGTSQASTVHDAERTGLSSAPMSA